MSENKSWSVPCHSELDEVHQVLAAVTNSAGFVAVSVTRDAPGDKKTALNY